MRTEWKWESQEVKWDAGIVSLGFAKDLLPTESSNSNSNSNSIILFCCLLRAISLRQSARPREERTTRSRTRYYGLHWPQLMLRGRCRTSPTQPQPSPADTIRRRPALYEYVLCLVPLIAR